MKLKVLNTLLAVLYFVCVSIIPDNLFPIKILLAIIFILWVWFGDRLVKD